MSEAQMADARGWLERVAQFFYSSEPENREELLELLRDAHRRNLIENEALHMIEGVLRVSELKVRDIMIARAQMVVVPHDAELDTIYPLVVESAHSRFPVIAEDRSEVVGVLLVKDLLAQTLRGKGGRVESIMRNALFVPESKRLNILLREFRTSRTHMAIVVDEYGGCAGLVTIEDVLEQIVGDIEDEHDFGEEVYIFKKSDAQYRLKALTPIDEFNSYFTAHLNDQEFDTVGGLIVSHFGHVPHRGEQAVINGYQFTVLRADARRVHLLQLDMPAQTETSAD
jgi:magnesium and cobalt transporter